MTLLPENMPFYFITGIHVNIGPKGKCQTPKSDYLALCESYNSTVITYAELKAAHSDGFECYMCGWTTGGRYYFCQDSPGYCTKSSPSGNVCMSCGNIFCKHSTGKWWQFVKQKLSWRSHSMVQSHMNITICRVHVALYVRLGVRNYRLVVISCF